jgi:hypothetical protein
MNPNPNYVLTENESGRIVIATDWAGLAGETYDRHSLLRSGMRASEFVTKHLLGKADGLPMLTADPKDKFVDYAWNFLSRGVAPEVLEFSLVYHELKKKNIALPIEIGPSMADRGLGSL